MKKYFLAMILANVCVFFANAKQFGLGMSIGRDFGGGVESSLSSEFGESFKHTADMQELFIDFFVPLDFYFVELSAGFFYALDLPDHPNDRLPYSNRQGIDLGLYAKFPFELFDYITVFPLAGITYQIACDGSTGNDTDDLNYFDTSMLWLQFGAGIDIGGLRFEFLYGFRPATSFEKNYGNALKEIGEAGGLHGKIKNIQGHGLVVKAALMLDWW